MEVYLGLIDRMSPDGQKLARKILGSVLLALRFLKMGELQQILGPQVDGPTLALEDGDCKMIL